MAKALICLLLAIVAAGPARSADPAGPSNAGAPVAVKAELYIFLFRPGPNWRDGVPMRDQDLRAHAAYHSQLVREGRGFAGGGYTEMDGGMAIVRAANRSEAEAILAADPAILNGVFTAEVRAWRPRFYSQSPLIEPAR